MHHTSCVIISVLFITGIIWHWVQIIFSNLIVSFSVNICMIFFYWRYRENTDESVIESNKTETSFARQLSEPIPLAHSKLDDGYMKLKIPSKMTKPNLQSSEKSVSKQQKTSTNQRSLSRQNSPRSPGTRTPSRPASAGSQGTPYRKFLIIFLFIWIFLSCYLILNWIR